jgi:hypothetical protein
METHADKQTTTVDGSALAKALASLPSKQQGSSANAARPNAVRGADKRMGLARKLVNNKMGSLVGRKRSGVELLGAGAKVLKAAAEQEAQLPVNMDKVHVAPSINPEERQVAGAQVSAALQGHHKTSTLDVPTFGKGHFGLPAAAMTESLKRDLDVLGMRQYLDRKRFYKGEGKSRKGKQFKVVQVGRVVAGVGETGGLTKRQQKASFAEEVFADRDIRSYSKRVAQEVTSKAAAGGKKAFREAKKRRQGGRR